MKPVASVLLICLLVLLSYCDKTHTLYQPVKRCTNLTANVDTVHMYFQGKWEWLEEKRQNAYQSYQYLTPNSENYTYKLEVRDRTMTFYKSNGTKEKYTFAIVSEGSISGNSNDKKTVIVFFEYSSGVVQNYVPLKICTEHLVLQYQYSSSVLGEQTWKKLD